MDFKIWFVICLAFIVLEMLAPGFFLLWVGVAAGITALSVMVFSVENFILQSVIFSLVSIVLILVANKNKPKLKPGDPSLNNKTFRMIGRVVTLNSDEHGGVVDIDDTLWRLVDDQKNMFSKGDLVKVQALENGKLRLAKIEKNDQA